jgi:hypothetical protein
VRAGPPYMAALSTSYGRSLRELDRDDARFEIAEATSVIEWKINRPMPTSPSQGDRESLCRAESREVRLALTTGERFSPRPIRGARTSSCGSRPTAVAKRFCRFAASFAARRPP